MSSLGRGAVGWKGLRRTAAGLVLAGSGLVLTTSAVGAAPPSTLGPVMALSTPPYGYLTGVSCTDATDCTAVGYDYNDEPVYATESGGVWGPTTEITALGPGGAFSGVSCTDATDCTAVGQDDNGQPFYATETGGVWGPATQISAPGGGGYFSGVSCTDATDCTAVGEDDNGQPFYATETGGVWGPATQISAPAGGGYFSGVSCTDATDCTAVGTDFNGQPFYATETGGAWGPATEISAPGPGGYFTGVSCTDATDCTAVGADYNGQPFYVTETGGVWGTPTEISAPGGGGDFSGVSCTDATDCTAVGGDFDNEPFAATETAGVWGPGADDPAPGGGSFSSVSCTSATFCTAVGGDENSEPIVTGDLALPMDGSQVHAVIQVETSPAFAGDTVTITSLQLQNSCGGTVLFETLQKGSTAFPTAQFNSITVVLDDDGNVTVVVDGADCAAGTDLIEADMTGAPYLTATTSLVVLPPQVTTAGVAAYPSTEVETGNDPASGNSDIYTVFYVETDPTYAEQPVTITSPQLENRCGQGWRWEPGMGTAIDQASGTTVATGTLDNDGNAVFVFKGASCAAGTSTVTADIDAGTHATYTTTFTVGPPVVTASTMKLTTKAHKPHKHHHRQHKGSRGIGSGSGGTTPTMTVTASPNPLVETGGGAPPQPVTCGECGG